MRCSALMICWSCDVSDQCRMLSVCLKGSVRILDTKSLKLEEEKENNSPRADRKGSESCA